MAHCIDPNTDQELKIGSIKTLNSDRWTHFSSGRVSKKRLKEWSVVKKADALVLSMSEQSKPIQDFLSGGELQEESVLLLVKTLAHATTTRREKAAMRQVLEVVCGSNFLVDPLKMFIFCYLESMDDKGVHEFVGATVRLLRAILEVLPEQAMKCVLTSAQLVSVSRHVVQDKQLKESVVEVDRHCKEIYWSNKTSKHKSQPSCLAVAPDDEDPPECYRSLPIIPSVSELTAQQTKVLLRKNVTDGPYSDPGHYFDVHFRLLRQDFFHHLQHGIAVMRQCRDLSSFKHRDLRLFYNVRVVGMRFENCCNYILLLEHADAKKTRYVNKKIDLSPGSLVFLSRDGFQNIAVAVVTEPDPLNMEQYGLIAIDVKEGLEGIFTSTATDVYTMAESTAHFKTCYNVLKLLSGGVTTDTPLEDTILYCDHKPKPPKYLLPSSGYTGIPYYTLSDLMLDGKNVSVPVLTTVKWPSAEDMCLNDSQREAAMLALTKEIAVIQGPPGTGKSHVGRKILEVLLCNEPFSTRDKTGQEVSKKSRLLNPFSYLKDRQNSKCSKGPILIVCKSVKALLKITKTFDLRVILPIGPSELIHGQDVLLVNEFKSLKKLKLLKSSPASKSDLRLVADKINELNDLMGSLETDIQSDDLLSPFMLDHHFHSLTRGLEPGKCNRALKQWLKSPPDPPMISLMKSIEHRLKHLMLQWNRPHRIAYCHPSMSIVERVSNYCHVAGLYRERLKKQIKEMKNDDLLQTKKKDLKLKLHQSYDDFIPVNFIYEILGKSYGVDMRAWLKESARDPWRQLNDIETLTREMELKNAKAVSDVNAGEASTEKDDDVEEKSESDPFANVDKFRSIAVVKNAFKKYEVIALIKRAEKLSITEVDPRNVARKFSRLTHAQVIELLALTQPMTDQEEADIADVWELNEEQRFALYKSWVQKCKTVLTQSMSELSARYNTVGEEGQEIEQSTLSELKRAKVIGMTAEAAAENMGVLIKVGCRVVVVVEAAKLLESHVVTLLTQRCEHLIMIGDHQQLHANTRVSQIAKEFGLEVSLFERLIRNNVPRVQLRVQYTMRPEIADFMRLIYPEIKDDASVCDLDHVRGISKDVFFIDHRLKLSKDNGELGHSPHEAKYVAALCKYLLNQDYSPSDVTVLAPHGCQVRAIKSELTGRLKSDQRVKVTTVGEFQGQDSDIVLVSLAVGNEANDDDVMLDDGWVSVALSRAKIGLYVIGNFDVLACQSPLWSRIVSAAEENETIGWGLPVYCTNHPNTKQRLMNVADFGKCPEGGCIRPCEHQLRCGHSCVLSCHGYDKTHTKYKCMEKCSRLCNAGHPCEEHCYRPCPSCLVPVQKVFPVCGDLNEIPCHVDPKSSKCQLECSYKLPCKHKCSGICCKSLSSNVHKICAVPVPYVFSPCGHHGHAPCHKWNTQVPCDKLCDAVLSCGHKCQGSCSSCLRGAVHEVCREKCSKFLPCGHKCKGYCGTQCLPCTEICPFQCRHKSCNSEKHRLNCGQPCPPCEGQCVAKCVHVIRTKLCWQQWRASLCNKRCTKKFDDATRDGGAPNGKVCNHACVGICGEKCVCLHCDQVNEIKKSGKNSKQTLDEGLVSSILDNLDEKLLIKLPSCGHVFLVAQLDAFVDEYDPRGTSFIVCPVCGTPIMRCAHYDNILNARHKRREEQKALILSWTRVSEDSIRKLNQSYEMLKSTSPQMSEGFYISQSSHGYTTVEMQAMSFNIKILFALGQIVTLHASLDDDVTMDIMAMKDSVLVAPMRLTVQREQESLYEVLRCLKLKVLRFLENMNGQRGLPAPRGLTWQVESMISALRGSHRNPEYLSKSHAAIMSMSQIIGESSTDARAAVCPIIKKYKEIIAVMLSSYSKMLCDLVRGDEIQRMSDLTTHSDHKQDGHNEPIIAPQKSGPGGQKEPVAHPTTSCPDGLKKPVVEPQTCGPGGQKELITDPPTGGSDGQKEPDATAQQTTGFSLRSFEGDEKQMSIIRDGIDDLGQEGIQYQDMFILEMFANKPDLDPKPVQTNGYTNKPDSDPMPTQTVSGATPSKDGQFKLFCSRKTDTKTRGKKQDFEEDPFPSLLSRRVTSLTGNLVSRPVQSITGQKVVSGQEQSITGQKVVSRPMQSITGQNVVNGPEQSITGQKVVSRPEQSITGKLVSRPMQSITGQKVVRRPEQSIPGQKVVSRPVQSITGKKEKVEEEPFPCLTGGPGKTRDTSLTKPLVKDSDIKSTKPAKGHRPGPFVGQQTCQNSKISSETSSPAPQSRPSFSDMCNRAVTKPAPHKQTKGNAYMRNRATVSSSACPRAHTKINHSKEGEDGSSAAHPETSAPTEKFSVTSEEDFPTLGGFKK